MGSDELQLKVEDLRVGFPSLEEPDHSILRGMGFYIHSGEILGLMGPSGCGKTLTALTIMGLAGRIGAKVTSGRILFFCKGEGKRGVVDLMKICEEGFRSIRGRQLSMIWQNPVAVLDPVVTVGRQLTQTMAFYHGWERRMTRKQREQLESEAEEILKLCGLSGVHGIREKYPGQLSVGMCQRVAIGLGICGKPRLLIADEPTASLDHDSRDGIFDTLFKLRQELNMSILLITHDEKKCRESADRILRMEKGRVAEHE
jgi:peptide/nickel transport system ATP-binding protein